MVNGRPLSHVGTVSWPIGLYRTFGPVSCHAYTFFGTVNSGLLSLFGAYPWPISVPFGVVYAMLTHSLQLLMVVYLVCIRDHACSRLPWCCRKQSNLKVYSPIVEKYRHRL